MPAEPLACDKSAPDNFWKTAFSSDRLSFSRRSIGGVSNCSPAFSWFFLFAGRRFSLRGIGVSRHRAVAFAELRWFDPVTLPFERISRQGQPMPPFLRVKA